MRLGLLLSPYVPVDCSSLSLGVVIDLKENENPWNAKPTMQNAIVKMTIEIGSCYVSKKKKRTSN